MIDVTQLFLCIAMSGFSAMCVGAAYYLVSAAKDNHKLTDALNRWEDFDG